MRRILTFLLPALLACGGGLAEVPNEPPDEQVESLRVLFIGNSLTYGNDLPAIVQALADASGQKPLSYKAIALGGNNLEDHWRRGDARRLLSSQRWDVVVLQQGPSALPESRELLVAMARRFAPEIRKAGARPALYMVWPSQNRAFDFDAVSRSYALAAEAVDGLLMPAGEAWRAAWKRDSKLKLYSRDGLHPTVEGSYAAALVIYQRLYGRSPVGLPAELQLRSGRRLRIAPPVAQALQAAAAEANEKLGKP
jgi:hypothetical protein